MDIREEILFLSEADVRALFTPADAIAAAEDTFLHVGTGDVIVGEMCLMHVDVHRKNNFHSMPAVLMHKGVAGVKWIDTFADPLPGYPFSHGNLLIMSDVSTGSPMALVGVTAITNMRTAGGHGVVQAKYLAEPEPERLAVLGCGAQARAGIEGFLEQFPSIRQLRLFSRSRRPMDEVRRALEGRVEVLLCDSPAQAAESRLILAASGARNALITMDMLSPGTTVIGIAGFRDIDPNIGKKADKWYLGYRVPDRSILRSPKLNPNGILSMEDVYGDMTEVLTHRRPGRENDREIIVSTHMGMGAHDVACALTVYKRALEQGRGMRLHLN